MGILRLFGISTDQELPLERWREEASARAAEIAKDCVPASGVGTATGPNTVFHWFTGRVFVKGAHLHKTTGALPRPGDAVQLKEEKTGLLARGFIRGMVFDEVVLPLFDAHLEMFAPGDWFEIVID